jgi:hypothetical protein
MANRGDFDFTWTPTWVTPRAKQWPVLITQSESFKKDYQLLDTNSLNVYELEFDGVTDSTRNAILNHFTGVTGPYDSFWWSTVPSYLNIGSGVTVRYLPGSYQESPRARYWEITFSFEEDV